MTRLYQSYVVFVALLFLIFTGIFSLVEANQSLNLMTQGSDALSKGKYEAAEEFFKKALINLEANVSNNTVISESKNKIKQT